MSLFEYLSCTVLNCSVLLITVPYIQMKTQMQRTVCTLHFSALDLTPELHCFFCTFRQNLRTFMVHIGPVKLLRGVGRSNATQKKNSQKFPNITAIQFCKTISSLTKIYVFFPFLFTENKFIYNYAKNIEPTHPTISPFCLGPCRKC